MKYLIILLIALTISISAEEDSVITSDQQIIKLIEIANMQIEINVHNKNLIKTIYQLNDYEFAKNKFPRNELINYIKSRIDYYKGKAVRIFDVKDDMDEVTIIVIYKLIQKQENPIVKAENIEIKKIKRED